MLNELAEEFAIGFTKYCLLNFGRISDKEITIKEALENYKKTI